MKLPCYKELIKMSESGIKGALAPFRVIRAKKQAELEMAKLEEEIATQETKIKEECCKENINFARIIEMQDTLALTERKKVQYRTILKEMFPSK